MVLSFAVKASPVRILAQHVVHAGQGQRRVLRLLAFAVGVELFGEGADAGLLVGRGVWEGEGLEAAGFVVARTLPSKRAAGRQRPDGVDGAGQDAQQIGVVESDGNQLIVWRRMAASRN